MRAEQLRKAMVRELLAEGRIRHPEVERAFRRVPRHLFLPELDIAEAYRDEAVATKWLDGVTISSASQPSMMAIMLEQLAVRQGDRVLEVGAGSGYNAALIAELVGRSGAVVSVDIDADLVEGAAAHLADAGVVGVTLATADGALGHPGGAPYDRIVLTVGSWDIQPAWWSQLAPGGRLLLPLSVAGSQLSVALDLVDGAAPYLSSDSVRGCAFVRLRGAGAVDETGVPLEPDGPLVAPARPGPVDVAGLRALLARPTVRRPSEVALTAVDLWDGFGLWLSLREATACRLLVQAPGAIRWPSLLPAGIGGGTVLLAAGRGAAMVAPVKRTGTDGERTFPVVVHGYGPDGPRLVERMDQLLRAWAAAGRPAAAELRVRAYPAGQSPPPGSAFAIAKGYSTLLFDWPGNPVANGPILER